MLNHIQSYCLDLTFGGAMRKQTPTADLPRLSSKRRWIGVVVVALGLLVFYCVYLAFHPYDEVEIVIRGLPADTKFVCLIADRPGGPVVMLWSLSKVFPFTMHPDACTVSDISGGGTTRRAALRWINSKRVGVLRKAETGTWFVALYNGPKTELGNRSLLFGQGSWAGDWPDADNVQQWSGAELRPLGFEYSLVHR